MNRLHQFSRSEIRSISHFSFFGADEDERRLWRRDRIWIGIPVVDLVRRQGNETFSKWLPKPEEI